MKQFWDAEELGHHWSLTYEELKLLKTKTVKNHIAFCAQLKYYQCYGCFPEDKSELADLAIGYLVAQLEIDISTFHGYNWSDRTARSHKQEILDFLGIRKINETDRVKLYTCLCETVFPNGNTVKDSIEYVHEWLHNKKIDRPTGKQLEREIASANSKFETDLFEKLTSHIPLSTIQLIDYCLDDSNELDMSFNLLKSDPGRISLDSVLKEIAKLDFINSLELPDSQLSTVNSKIIDRLRQRILSETAWEVRRHPVTIRYALMSVFFYTRKSEIIDSLIELFVQIVHRLSTKAERRVIKSMVKDFKKVYGKDTLFMKIAEAALKYPDGAIKDVVYPIAGEQTLANIIKEYKSSGKGYNKEVHNIIRSSYGGHYRRMVPKILDNMEFYSNNQAHRPVLDALEWIRLHKDSKQQYYLLSESIPVDGVIRPKWYETTIEVDDKGEERVNRINYEICVLQALRDKLRCKEIWVSGADKYRNPDEDLPQDFNVNRTFYYNDLGISQDAEGFVYTLRKRMCESLESLNRTIPNNKKVKLISNSKNQIVLTPLSEQAEPQNINRLKGQVQSTWPMTSLLDILKEADLRVGFTDCFGTQRSTERLNRDAIQKRLLLALYGMGTNTGLKRISASRHGVSYKELLHIRKFYIHKTALRKAISSVVNAIFEIRNPHLWGEGTTACASDSKKFGSWDQNLMTEWHIRYGGRGVMIYWHVEKKSTCIYSQLKRCSSSESSKHDRRCTQTLYGNVHRETVCRHTWTK